jgi:hypothetical protein
VPGKSNNRLWILSAAIAFLTLAVVAIPLIIIQPFKPQDDASLQFALALKSWTFTIVTLCVIASFAVANRLRRWPAYVATTLTVVFAAASFINVFELMFHPIDQPTFAQASDAKIEGDDMVLAVKLGGQSRAYPVRTLAYHHIVNDRVNGVPIVATY